jgi:hypothetical protein
MKETAMQKLLIVLTVLFLIIIAPALLIALSAPERLGLILLLWTAIAAIVGGIVWYRVRSITLNKS